jgi:hypothetical protein
LPLDNNIYRVLLDSDWQLADLYTFPHAFSQTYAFVYCLDSELDPTNYRDTILISKAANRPPLFCAHSVAKKLKLIFVT